MKVLIDTCVLYPTVMRQMLLGAAGHGLFTPLWSDRILEEWARAARKIGPTGEAQARSEIALLKIRWAANSVIWPPSLATRLWLPDPNDIHVLAAAIAGSADVIVTLNAADFPRNTLAEEGLSRSDPDSFLCGYFRNHPTLITALSDQVLTEAQQLSGKEWTRQKLLKKAGLSRLAKAINA
ncbi:MAG: PIN domain-containing protein [Rhodobacteraceae bacterium]|jgi:predicted nucleic acid-binding protein|nr:PIN domain-containing protein [Paracoccaceae bacterium]MBT6297737.1 PIN domain-containing protein [Paracoccaceae bacterium]MBT6542675.1 PIN domain-containing protein [Paracoccaceae bacterium]MDE2634190.1 PIN domain-containing protein [Paracoccaceae bacterium]HBR61846.1 PIN domain-containing protein [Paracoccaceae bacterium]|tara:strand:- start:1245 stop:1787 length:543 start_codon:yes stop_codon:yes gene_type:complete